ncbi:MAG: 1-deoxy-D-xylulose-5-phosphate reductoisomerase [Clostridiales bacterium]|nr:1-deoxy-D-xylulose-5-phosphate reductoisomerase [Clostridiales bacterium]
MIGEKRKIAILGSTGSIGTQTLDIVREHGDIEAVALACGNNIALMERQMREFRPKLVSVGDEAAARELAAATRDLDIPIRYGMDGLIEAATCPGAEMVVTAVVGMMGIRPTVAAIEAGRDIALANKETLVTAGHIIMLLAKKYGVKILPVDSEHSAIFQSLQGNEGNKIKNIWLTASGGPFRGKKRDELLNVTAADALNHPNWSMGKKVTIDSATLVNKGLEVMEARWLFSLSAEQIKVVVHPQSVVHSAVEYVDGAVMAQLGTPDMHIPIQYALYYPRRLAHDGKKLDPFEMGQLSFERPDLETFPGLSLAFSAMGRGGNMPTVFNAANEMAVKMFLNGEIRFLQICDIIAEAMENCHFVENPDLNEILGTEQETYGFIRRKFTV